MSEVIAPRPRLPTETRLSLLAAWLGDRLIGGSPGSDSPPLDQPLDPIVTGVSLSSHRIVRGDLYAALPGARVHGSRFARAAVDSGAVAIVTDAEGAGSARDLGVPVLVVERPRALLGALAARVYDHPAESLRLVAVTGTAGKTTATRLAGSGLEHAGVPAAVVGTLGTRIRGREVPSALTTPEAPDLHALFAVMREEGVRGAAMEVSSHALVMGRVDGVVFDVAAFTNLGRDHLDFHADVEDYFSAKAGLFTAERARRGLVNIDDGYGQRLRREATIPLRTFSASGAEADWRATDVVATPTGSRFTVVSPTGERIPAQAPIPGAFNVANALVAVAALAEVGFDAAAVADGIASSSGVPGRFEQVRAGQDFLALVDYAHKPDAVTAALEALAAQTPGRLIVILGAGGDRDPGKREVMGEVAARLADVLVVTDDNPRTEDPALIRAAVLAGAEGVSARERAETHECADRREAVRLAVSLATSGDTVVVAGKGHESGQDVAGTVHPFDDRVVLRDAVEALPS